MKTFIQLPIWLCRPPPQQAEQRLRPARPPAPLRSNQKQKKTIKNKGKNMKKKAPSSNSWVLATWPSRVFFIFQKWPARRRPKGTSRPTSTRCSACSALLLILARSSKRPRSVAPKSAPKQLHPDFSKAFGFFVSYHLPYKPYTVFFHPMLRSSSLQQT